MNTPTTRRAGGVIFIVILLLSSMGRILNSATLSSSNKKSVYSIMYEMLSIDLGRGQTVSFPVQVAPSDLPGVFALSTPDGRVLVTADPQTGSSRTITIRDQTSMGDGSANTPDILSLGMHFPDGTNAVTSTGQLAKSSINLKKIFLEYTRAAISAPGNAIQTVIDHAPVMACDGIGSGLISGLNTVASNANPPQAGLNSSQQAAAHAIANQLAGNYCNALGFEAGSSVQVAVDSMPPNIANTLIGRGEVPPSPDASQTVTVTLAGFSFNSNGNVALTTSPGEFVNTSSPWLITLDPIIRQASQLQVSASARSATYTGEVRGSCTINYSDGTFNFSTTNNISIQTSWHFGGP